MKDYKGVKNDKPEGGGKWVKEHGSGGEIYNFLPYNGYMYGYVQPARSGSINIEKLGASEQDEKVEGALVVWTAKRPRYGTVIVGWYDNAIIYRNFNDAPKNSNRLHRKDLMPYNIKAKEENCHRLLPYERNKKIPRGKGWMGQSNVWYADSKKHEKFKKEVLDYITDFKKGRIKKIPPKTLRQHDPYKRSIIEKKATDVVKREFERDGYYINSVEQDNLGWDLEATKGDITLKIEVKGLSQQEINIELTPNEYRMMERYKDSDYVICVVTNILKKPRLSTFLYSPESNRWEDKKGNQLIEKIVKSARMYL